MHYRKSLEEYKSGTIIVRAHINKIGRLQFRKPLWCKHISTGLYSPVYRINHDFKKSESILATTNSNCLDNIYINNKKLGEDSEHIWIPYDLSSKANENNEIIFYGRVGSYKRKNGTEDYAIEYLGIDDNENN